MRGAALFLHEESLQFPEQSQRTVDLIDIGANSRLLYFFARLYTRLFELSSLARVLLEPQLRFEALKLREESERRK